MLDLQAIEELFKSEEFAKNSNRAALNAIFRNMVLLQNPNIDKKSKEKAQAEINAIAQKRKTPKKVTSTPPTSILPKFQALEGNLDNAQAKINEIERQKNLESIARQKLNIPKTKKQIEQEEDARQVEAFGYSKRELQAQVNRATRDPNAWTPKELKRELSPQQAAAAFKVKAKAKVDKALDLAHQLHGHGLIDEAHKLISHIPGEHLPDHLKDYNPDYLHYNVSPKMWEALPSEHKEHVHNLHKEILAGQHDNSPDTALKTMAAKVKSIRAPKSK